MSRLPMVFGLGILGLALIESLVLIGFVIAFWLRNVAAG